MYKRRKSSGSDQKKRYSGRLNGLKMNMKRWGRTYPNIGGEYVAPVDSYSIFYGNEEIKSRKGVQCVARYNRKYEYKNITKTILLGKDGYIQHV